MKYTILLFTLVITSIGVEGILKMDCMLTRATGTAVAKGFNVDSTFGTVRTGMTQAQTEKLPKVKSEWTSNTFQDHQLVIAVVENSKAKSPFIPAETFENALVPDYDGGWGVNLLRRDFSGQLHGEESLKVDEFYLVDKDEEPAAGFKRVCSAIIQGGEADGKTVYIYTGDRSKVTLPCHYGFRDESGFGLPI